MAAYNTKGEEDRRSFEYVLEDYLELKAEAGPQKARSLKAYLLSRGERNLTLRPVEGFRFNGHLVVIEKGSARKVTRLVLFDPEKGSIRVKEIAA